jgi:hypothetical protein
LKNQFRALDDDEAEFLDSVLEETRKKEAEVKRETLQQLDKFFRKYQEEAERKALAEQNAGGPEVEDAQAQWATAGRKRKKVEKDGGLLKGVKLRKASSSADKGEAKQATTEKRQDVKEAESKPAMTGTGTNLGTSTKAQSSSETDTLENTSGKATVAGSASPEPTNSLALGLGYASSSDEDD